MERYERRMRLPIIASAVLPLIVVPEAGNWLGEAVGVVTWLVFLFDFVMHTRHLVRYRRTRLGRFDLLVVVLTAPWYLLPGAHWGNFVVVLRLARLARIVLASHGARRLFERLGRVAVVAGAIVVVSSFVAYYAEHQTNSEFATVGDALWWGIVTLTTVGYGDIVPKTTVGRWAGVTIMITGIAVLGVLAGSLASFFRVNPDGDAPSDDEEQALSGADEEASGTAVLRSLVTEVAALRRQVEELNVRLAGMTGPPDDS
jgi:voltage-gated potassium channel